MACLMRSAVGARALFARATVHSVAFSRASFPGQARSFQSTPTTRGGTDSHDDVGGHNGWLFGKNPDVKHEREAWEIPYMVAAGSSILILGVGLTYKPKTSIKVWALDQVKKQRGEA